MYVYVVMCGRELVCIWRTHDAAVRWLQEDCEATLDEPGLWSTDDGNMYRVIGMPVDN